jgi:3-oxoacyl-[acyl-carrier protein] reductase
MDLRTAKVFITGGSSGIGLETARMLRQAGAAVAICGRRKDELERAAKETDTIAIPCDVSKEDEVQRAIAEAIDKLGGLNVVVNNAGWGKFAKLVDLDLAEFRAVLDTNVVGAMLVAREAARYFVKQDYGNIVNVSSTVVAKGAAGGSSYVASKGALKGLNDSWRAELRKHNVRVMLVNPSEVLTNFSKTAGHDQKQSERKLRGEEIAAAIKGILEMDDRGFTTELTVFATNPD